jgi:hypothetical protein
VWLVLQSPRLVCLLADAGKRRVRVGLLHEPFRTTLDNKKSPGALILKGFFWFVGPWRTVWIVVVVERRKTIKPL